MKKWVVALLFGSALVLGACGGGDDGNNNGASEADPAEAIYKNSCASCHGGDLSGGAGPDLTEIGSKYSADDINDIIQNGIGTMQPQNVAEDDREVLSEWLAGKK